MGCVSKGCYNHIVVANVCIPTMLVDGVSTINCALEHHLPVSMDLKVFSRFEIILIVFNMTSLISNFSQTNLSISGDDVDMCPLLLQSSFGDYLLPVQVRQIELITRNLPSLV